ncbi:hypothetical protein [Candidatus Stoquefichus massiliensis]|nr:hypothetical protein [Candidatus Stoquefichus massiliensis]
MDKFTKGIKKTLTKILTNMTFGIDILPSWVWIYEPEKPELLKNK